MSNQNAQNASRIIDDLTEAINKGNLNAAVALYESDAVLVTQPGTVARGKDQIREALKGFISLEPVLTSESRELVETETIVLYCSKWRLRGTSPDGKSVEMTGISSDVLRRQPGGKWLIAIDNPWGAAIVR